MMASVIAVANQKGGVGKTTTVVNLAAFLAESGCKILVVDADPQGNATTGLGVDKQSLEASLYEALHGTVDPVEIVQATAAESVHLLPATVDLAGAEIELVTADRREYRLRGILERFRDRYDYILIDCPPSLGLMTVNALAAADGVLVPIQCEFYALEGLSQLMQTLQRIRDSVNAGLELEGILMTMFDARTNLAIQVVDEVKRHFRGKVYSAIVPRNVRLSEAPSHGRPISRYDPRSRGAEVYRALAREFLQRMGEGRRRLHG